MCNRRSSGIPKWQPVFLSLAATVALCIPPTIAAPPGFNSGVKLYQAHKYKDAVGQFGAALQRAPRDPLTHYYLGLCYQGMNQMMLATQEFKWVAYYGSGSVQSQAQAALQNLSHLGSHEPVGSTPQSSSSAPRTVANNAQTAATSQTPRSVIIGRLKIYEFTQATCPVCKKFARIWSNVASKMSTQADFRQLDMLAPENKDMVAKYGIHLTPDILFMDDRGNVVHRLTGAYSSENQFIAEINQVLGH